jgi:hypothetical protein
MDRVGLLSMTEQAGTVSPATLQELLLAPVRPVFFDTGSDGWRYGTHGGTLFLAMYKGRVFGLTCKHVFGDFDFGQLFVSGERHPQRGAMPARIQGQYCPGEPTGQAQGTDAGDLCAIEFGDEVQSSFFDGTPYLITDEGVGTAQPGHRLLVAGVLKDKTTLIPNNFVAGYCRLEFIDIGRYPSDPFLRQASAAYLTNDFDNLVGISGSPVYNLTAGKLCGMVCRGGMTGRRANILYFDIFDVVKFLDAAASRSPKTNYTKALGA